MQPLVGVVVAVVILQPLAGVVVAVVVAGVLEGAATAAEMEEAMNGVRGARGSSSSAGAATTANKLRLTFARMKNTGNHGGLRAGVQKPCGGKGHDPDVCATAKKSASLAVEEEI